MEARPANGYQQQDQGNGLEKKHRLNNRPELEVHDDGLLDVPGPFGTTAASPIYSPRSQSCCALVRQELAQILQRLAVSKFVGRANRGVELEQIFPFGIHPP